MQNANLRYSKKKIIDRFRPIQNKIIEQLSMHYSTAMISLLTLAVIFLGGAQHHLFASEKGFETAPVFQAKDILPPELLEGTEHRVAQEVKNDGYMNHYLLSSRFGEFEAVGYPMLQRRIHEIYALALLEEHSSTKVAVETGKEVGTKVAESTVKGVKKLGAMASDPEELASTLSSVPGGVVNLFHFAADTVGTGVDYVSATGKEMMAGSDESGGQEGTGSTLTQKAGELALQYSGYSKASAKWAKELEIDPYTENELLRSEIRRVATVEATVGFAGRFTPKPPSIPGVNEANKWLNTLEGVSLYDDPAKIAELNLKVLESLGMSEDEVLKFAGNEHYTPTTRTLLLGAIKSLEGVEKSGDLLILASAAKSSAGAWYFVHAVQQLSRFHQKRPFTSIITDLAIPSAITKSGHYVVPLPVDHLVWTVDVAAIFTDAHEMVGGEFSIGSSEVVVAGTVSSRSLKELEKQGFNVAQERGYE